MTSAGGLGLAGRFYREAVRPVMDRHLPGLPHTACLVGQGSEVLGYDDIVSTDHDWGPRLQLLVSRTDHERLAGRLTDVLAAELPPLFEGWSTHWTAPDVDDRGTRLRGRHDGGPIGHRVEVLTVGELFGRHLGPAADHLLAGDTLTAPEWLATPQQELLGLTAGELFHDDLGLSGLRAKISFFPTSVWLYLMASAWSQIGEDEHLMPRAGQVGDDLGSRVVAARLVRTAMQLAFLQERRYAPYAKWFGTAFARLDVAPVLGPPLAAALAAPHWAERTRHLADALEVLAVRHNELGLTTPVPTTAKPFHDRPFPVIGGSLIATTLAAHVTDPALALLRGRRPIGGIDQVTTSTDLLSSDWREHRRVLYEA